MFGSMTVGFFDYHLVLLFRLLGMATLLGLLAMVGALVRGLRIASRGTVRQGSLGAPLWQRRTQ